jgi:exonuclease SbcC
VVGVIDAEEQKRRGEIRLTEHQVANAERAGRERERLATQVRDLDRELAAEPDQDAALQVATSVQQALQQEFSDLSAANREVGSALDDIKDVIEMLERPRAVCPVCESDLSGDKRALTLARQQAKRDQLLAHQRDVQQAGRAKKQALTAAQEATAALTAARDAQVARRNRLADLRSHLATLGDPARELAAHRNRLETLQGQVARGEFAAPQRAQRVRLQAEHERLGLAKSEYEAVRQQIIRLEPARRRYQELLQAEAGLDRECANIERLERALAEGARTRSELEATLAELRKRLARYAEVAATADRADADLKRLQGELNTLAIAEGSLVRYIAEAERAEADRRARETLKSQVDGERRMYAALAKAFGKSGVQALIIENAIPELADEANMLLARMTDNAMQLSFETVRAAKQGGHEIETLDIRIADDAGVRPYELFSGGEAFRINFAIRIALSRLLARRSGARLQTLIMDEGFGSQDGKGREKLVELIETIKDDFEKILVITHVEELKDAFANRVEITKDAAGSHIHLL